MLIVKVKSEENGTVETEWGVKKISIHKDGDIALSYIDKHPDHYAVLNGDKYSLVDAETFKSQRKREEAEKRLNRRNHRAAIRAMGER